MNNNEPEKQLEWVRKKLREQGPLILFDPKKYKLEQRLNYLQCMDPSLPSETLGLVSTKTLKEESTHG